MKEVIMQAKSFSADYPKALIYVGDLVRCKDCIRNNDGNLCDIAYYINEDGDGFCNCGERKEPLPQYEEWQDEFNKMCESARPKTFVADEWYRDTFGENNGK